MVRFGGKQFAFHCVMYLLYEKKKYWNMSEMKVIGFFSENVIGIKETRVIRITFVENNSRGRGDKL